MIIDEILDRKDSIKYDGDDSGYDIQYMICECDMFGFTQLKKALLSKNEDEIKKELCKYVISQNYNPDICGFIWSVEWANPEFYNEDDFEEEEILEESMSEDEYEEYQIKLFDKALKYAVKEKDVDNLNGEYYFFDCMGIIFGWKYINMVSVKAFKNDEEAIDFGADYEATVKKYNFKNGEVVGRVKYIYEPHF